MRYLATIKYRGTNFCGWQKQTVSKLPSIQEEIERVLSKLLNSEIKIYGSGRTDAGVHAYGQTFHFDSPKEIDAYRFVHGFNELVSDDIVLTKLDQVSDDFHARFNASGKTYLYKINNENLANPFMQDLEYHMPQKLDIEEMKKAAQFFVGNHNFQNFTSKEEDEDNFARNIYQISVKNAEKVIEIELSGDGFMRYMVRMIVGTLIQVGLGKIKPSQIEYLLNQNPRKPSSYKAPACGLYLKEVKY